MTVGEGCEPFNTAVRACADYCGAIVRLMPTIPTRRTILRGAAWSAPVVTLAVAAPASAASGGTISIVDADYWPASNFGNVDAVLIPEPAGLTKDNVTVTFSEAGFSIGALALLASGDLGFTFRWDESTPAPAEFSVTISVPGYASITGRVTING